MSNFLAQHGLVPSVLLVLALFNIALSAFKSGVEKLEAFLSPSGLVDPNSSLEKLKAQAVKLLGWSSSVVDWLTANLPH